MEGILNKKINKYTIILIIVFLVIGFIAGFYVSSRTNINKSDDTTKINLLNNEINNCITQLNTCNQQSIQTK